jgi:predicted butyrate kinase (DUF1464 family)
MNNYKIIGIDPGTKSFDLLGVEFTNKHERIFLDSSIPSSDIARDPTALISEIGKHLPVTAIIGPSGYGLPVKSLSTATKKDLEFILPIELKKSVEVSVNKGIQNLFRRMKELKFPVYFTPGVIHLPTVPLYRKLNKIDLGTADKLCIAVLAMKDQMGRKKIPATKTSFILLEMGFGFTAGIAVKNGEVVDGLGGTSGFPGLLGSGHIDGELAIRFGKMSQQVLFSGGAMSLISEPLEDLNELPKYKEAFNLLIEGALKNVACLLVSNPYPYELILSGRLTRIKSIRRYLRRVFKKHFPHLHLHFIKRRAKVAKEAAEGAVVLGTGLLGIKYQDIIDSLKIKDASGTMYDYIRLVDLNKV